MTDPPASVPATRVLRVFISSTFRDLQAERDELVKRVFPRLRALCEARQVEWCEVDLRWGIPDELVAEGQVLPICLAEIEACRPFFIGLLADRYGWVPPRLPPHLIDAEPWLAGHLGRSVTEIEIIKGVLADPGMAAGAFFYFRDPGYAATIRADRRADFTESSPGQARLLADLKDRIRASGLPVRENYPDPRALGDLVYADLALAIEQRFPEREPAVRWQSEREGQAFYRAGLRIGYVVRPTLYEALDRQAAAAGPPLFVMGRPGAGKSALLANWIEHHRLRLPDVPVFSHFAAATAESDDADLAMWRLIGEIRDHRGLPTPETPRSPAELRRLFVETLGSSAGPRMVVVIDGADAIHRSDGSPGAEWIPRQVSESVRLIVSGVSPSVFAFGAPDWPGLIVGGLGPEERRTLAERYLGRFAKALAGPLLDRIVAHGSSADPLFLRLLLDELRVFGDHESLAARIDHYLATSSVPGLYQRILARWETDYGADRPHLVRDALRLLFASRAGLAESELLDLLGGDQPLPQGIWAPLRAGVAGSLTFRSGRIALANRSLRLAVGRRYASEPEAERALHSMLAGFFNRRGPTERTLGELPYQLMKAAEWQALATLLALPAYLVPTWPRRPGEVRRFWARVEAESPIRMGTAMAPILAADPLDPAVARAATVLLYEFRHYAEAERLAGRWAARLRVDRSPELPAALHLLAAARTQLGDLEGALAIYREEEDLARAAGADATVEFAWQGQALIALERGELDRAEALFGKIETYAARGQRDAMAAVALDNQALIRLKRGDAARALDFHERAEPLFQAAGDETGVARSLGNRGTILLQLGRLPEATAAYQAAAEWFRRLGDRQHVVATLINLTTVAAKAGDAEGQLDALSALTEAYRSLKDGPAALKTLQERGNLLFQRKSFEEALAVCREHAELAREISDLEALQGGLGNEAVALRQLGRFAEAVARLEEQATVCREMGDPDLEGRSLLRRAAVLHNRLARTADAIAVTTEARALAIGAGLTDLVEDANELLAMLGQASAGDGD